VRTLANVSTSAELDLIGPEHETETHTEELTEGDVLTSDTLQEGGRQLEGTADRPSQTVKLDLIVEGFGNKRDGHYYSRALLEREARRFEGAQMYANHLSEEARKRLGGNVRNIEDLMGRIRDVKVVEADGKLRLRGTASISRKWLWEMVEHDPGLLGVSINASGSSRVGRVEGRNAKIVEAISGVESVDWVTKAGAGGKVVELMEAEANGELGDDAEALTETEALTECDHGSLKSAGKKFCPDCGTKLTEAVAEGDDEGDAGEESAGASSEGTEGEAEKPAPEASASAAGEDAEASASTADASSDDDAEEGASDESAETGDEAEEKPAEGEAASTTAEEADEAEEEALDAAADAEVPKEDVREALARAIELRSEQKAEDMVEEAVDAALDENDRAWEAKLDKLREQLEEAHAAELTVVTHRSIAASMIDSEERLPKASRKALREEFFDARHEAEGDKDAEAVCREAVQAAIDKKLTELGEFVESPRSREDSDTASSDAGGQMQEGAKRPPSRPSGARRRRRADQDKKLDARIGIGAERPAR
jgi:hypothetical protein